MNNNEEIYNRLRLIKIENYIWVIYIGIIFLSWYANSFEKKYFLCNESMAREKYRKITIIIFSILIVIYLYFLKESINDIKNLKPYDTEEKRNLVYLSFLGSLFIVFSGLIFLYIAYVDENLNIEIAFN